MIVILLIAEIPQVSQVSFYTSLSLYSINKPLFRGASHWFFDKEEDQKCTHNT